MADWSVYGKIARRYEGSGTLTFVATAALDCEFEIVQVSTGQIYALCEVSASIDLAHYVLDRMAPDVQGHLSDGRQVSLEDPGIIEFSISSLSSVQLLTLRCRSATITSQALPPTPTLLRFRLVNLELAAPTEISIPEGNRIAIRPIGEYETIVKRLKASKGIDVTCELLIKTESIGETESILKVVDDVCLLLTLARGCQITWLFYDAETDHGTTLNSYHHSAITKGYSALTLIPTLPPGDTKTFLEGTYPALLGEEKRWGLSKAIKTYADAKNEQDYLQLRGLKLAVVLEHIRGQYLKQTNKTHILDHGTFTKAVESLVNGIRWFLPAVFPSATSEQLGKMADHARGMNYYPFRRAIKEMCQDLGLDISSKDRNRFVKLRNSLVHEVDFLPGGATPFQQYGFLLSFVGRVLLAILRYEGYYYDWAIESAGWTGSNDPKRVRLDLTTRK